jgi:integrase
VIADHPIPTGALAALAESPPLPTSLSDDERGAFLAAFDNEEGYRHHVETKRKLGPVKLGGASPSQRRYGGGRRGESESTGRTFSHFNATRPLFLCALDTGLTRGDLIDLRWHQVDLSGNLIRIRRAKTGVAVYVPMTARLAAELGALPRGQDIANVFVTSAGERWSETMVRRYFDIAKAIAGITRRFRFHDMRHDFASALAREGVSLLVIAQLLGHTTTRMTARYAHLHPDTLRAAIAGLAGRGSTRCESPPPVDPKVNP